MRLSLVPAMAAASMLMAAPVEDGAKEVMAAMNELRDALVHRDGPALERLLADDLSYVHSAGALESKADVVRANTTGSSVIEKIEYSNTTIHIHGDTALVRGRVDLWHSATNHVPMDVLHVWIRSGAQWRLAARQATRLEK